MADREPWIEVVYATRDVQRIVRVEHVPGLTARRAAELSRLAAEFPEIDEQRLVLGLYGERVALDHVLAPGDRVEICRPLHRDPRERRRELALRKPA